MTRAAAPPPGDTAFDTSGTTAAPVTWLRTAAQLTAEAELLVTALGRVDRVVCFAPPRHLYGRIFGVEIPRLLGVPALLCWDRPLDPPEFEAGARTLLACLPSTWQLLRRLPVPAAPREVIAVHSTARATGATFEVTQRLAGTGFRALEVLGSTETGAVATRNVDPVARDEESWRLLPDVGWRDTGPGIRPLTVSGPRLARRPGRPAPRELTMPDLVVAEGARTFRRIGRASGIVKVNGVRCDLGRVEQLVREALPGTDAACVPVADEIRGEHYGLYYASDGDLEPAQVRSRLTGALGSCPGPRTVIRVRRIPRAGDRVLTGELPGLAVAEPRGAR
ncbi:AMP-binding protein [Streptomyces sp. NPDC055254]